MPRTILSIDAEAEDVMNALASCAKKESFVIDHRTDSSMVVRKGSLGMSIMFGVFVVYAKAECRLKELDEGVKLTIEWSNPWWQGVFGPGRTRTAINGIVDRLERMRDLEVLNRKDG